MRDSILLKLLHSSAVTSTTIYMAEHFVGSCTALASMLDLQDWLFFLLCESKFAIWELFPEPSEVCFDQ